MNIYNYARLRIFIFLTLWVLISIKSHSQHRIAINVSHFSRPADKAAVVFGTEGNQASFSANEEGSILIPFPAPGIYTVKVSKGGFRSSFLELEMDAAQTLPHQLSLDVELLPRLEGISKTDPTEAEIFLLWQQGNWIPNPAKANADAAANYKRVKDIVGQRLKQFETKESHFREAGNKSFTEGNLQEALSSFRKAKESYPENLHPFFLDKAFYDKMIAECEQGLSSVKAVEENYQLAIKTADKFYADGDLQNAEKVYQQALTFKPNAAYPLEQIEKVRNEKKNQEANRMLFDIFIQSAEKWVRQKKYPEAIADYEQARTLIPSETFLGTKIEELKKLDDQRNQEYNNLIAIADRLKAGRNYEEALATYRRAKSVKAEEEYPSQQIAEITSYFKGQSSGSGEYDVMIAKADKHFEAGMWKEAQQAYSNALAAKSGDEYARQRRDESARLLKESIKKDADFAAAIRDGDDNMDLGNPSEAIKHYQFALGIKPANVIAQEKLSNAAAMLAAQQQRSAQLQELISATRQALQEEKPEPARTSVNEARSLAPNDKEVSKLVAEVDALEKKLQEKEAAYAAAISRGRQAETADKPADALKAYQTALEIKPAETMLVNKISALQNLIAERGKDLKIRQFIAEGDASMQKREFGLAMQHYEEALSLDPLREGLNAKLNAARDAIQSAAAKEKEFTALVQSGDEAVAAGDHRTAVNNYTNALAIMEDAGVRQKLGKAESALRSLTSNQNALQDALDAADAAITARDVNTAENAIREAENIIASAGIDAGGLPGLKDRLENLRSEIRTDEAYAAAVQEGDAAMQQKETYAAINAYLKAQREKDVPEIREKLATAYNLQYEMEDVEKRLNEALTEARTAMQEENWESAVRAYTRALETQADHPEAKEGLQTANRKAREATDKANAFRTAFTRAEEAYGQGNLELASRAVQEALDHYPEHSDAIALKQKITQEMEEAAELLEAYASLIRKGDSLNGISLLPEALQAFEDASQIKPQESYPKDKVNEIKSLLAEKDRLEKEYTRLMAEGEAFKAEEKWLNAKMSFEAAASLKPGESLAATEAEKMRLAYEADLAKRRQSYDALISEADAAWQRKVMDEAVSKYREAALVMPEESYPESQIKAINTYLEEHLVVELNRDIQAIPDRSEQKFKFTPLNPKQRRSTYILLTATNPSPEPLKVFLNYGKGSTKNGGIVFKAQPEKGQYIIRVSSQYRWYDVDNDWIGIYPEGGAFEVSVIQIATGD